MNSPGAHSEIPGTTALHAAAEYGKTEAVELLLRMGANASQGDANGYSPMHNAAMWGHLKVIEVLLEASVADEALNFHAPDMEKICQDSGEQGGAVARGPLRTKL